MPEITAERVRELAEQAHHVKGGFSSSPFDYVDAAVRLGIREGMEAAARHCDYHYPHLAELFRAIRIEGEER